MESAGMDPELAAEMVKLLGQELKIVRSQLREAEQVEPHECILQVHSSYPRLSSDKVLLLVILCPVFTCSARKPSRKS